MTAEATRRALDAVRAAPTILDGLRRGRQLTDAVARDDPDEAAQLLAEAAADPRDQLTAVVATHALGAVPGEAADGALVALLVEGPSFLRAHAATALGARRPVPAALPALVGLVTEGGFGAMIAQRTLEHWATTVPYAVQRALELVLTSRVAPLARARLVETLGLVPGSEVEALLRAVALDEEEGLAARAAAVAALGERHSTKTPHAGLGEWDACLDRPETTAALLALAEAPGVLAPIARLALDDLAAAGPPALAAAPAAVTPFVAVAPPAVAAQRAEPGLTIAQLFLHADIDGALSHAGRGDTGGIATLLVHLGDALLDAEPRVERVLTISRGAPDDALDGLARIHEPGHHYLSVPLWGPTLHAAEAWPHRVATRRGIRRILRAAGRVDAIHLRMGDVGSMAAAAAAYELGVPVVLTLAPDPHGLIAAREAAGTLTRADFGEADEVEHLTFRVALLRDLEEQAAHVVLFPRPDLDRDARALLGLDGATDSDRVSVVAEGISLRTLDGPGGAGTRDALAALDDVLATLPAERRGLPIAVSVGRLHRVKGTATLVEAWAGDPALSARCNLLVVGGDLKDPTDDEEEQLARIEATVPSGMAAARGLLLSGHRPNATVGAWLRAVRHGRGTLAAPGGVYVSASLKEEFGIAILEAMAAGLVVVAPDGGGPATYVTRGITGVLTDTRSVDALARAIGDALDLAGAPGVEDRAAAARDMVRERFGIETMAGALARIYEAVAARRHTPPSTPGAPGEAS